MENVLAAKKIAMTEELLENILESIKDFCDECIVDKPEDCVSCYLNTWRERADE